MGENNIRKLKSIQIHQQQFQQRYTYNQVGWKMAAEIWV